MLEVKSPWNNETVGTVKTHNSSEIESILQEACRISIHKGEDFPPKELRSIIDQGKKDIKSGIVISISIFEDKVGLAVGVSQDLTSKYDAVDLAKSASIILNLLFKI